MEVQGVLLWKVVHRAPVKSSVNIQATHICWSHERALQDGRRILGLVVFLVKQTVVAILTQTEKILVTNLLNV